MCVCGTWRLDEKWMSSHKYFSRRRFTCNLKRYTYYIYKALSSVCTFDLVDFHQCGYIYQFFFFVCILMLIGNFAIIFRKESNYKYTIYIKGAIGRTQLPQLVWEEKKKSLFLNEKELIGYSYILLVRLYILECDICITK